jgi:thiol-disulfide isomerase/thioredoxin
MKVFIMRILYLFTRKDCPTCPVAEQMVEEVMQEKACDTVVKVINADSISESLQYDLLENQMFVFAVPTIIVKDEEKMKLVSSGTLPSMSALKKAVGG